MARANFNGAEAAMGAEQRALEEDDADADAGRGGTWPERIVEGGAAGAGGGKRAGGSNELGRGSFFPIGTDADIFNVPMLRLSPPASCKRISSLK
jgi:hypothetical protein